MPKKKSEWKRKARARKISKTLKKTHAKARLIREREPHLSYKEALARVKESFIGTVRRKESMLLDRYIQMGPGVFKRLQPGMPAKRIFSMGRDLTYSDVERARGLQVYWGLVQRMADRLDKPVSEVRKMFRDFKMEMDRVARLVGKKRQFRTRDVAAVIEFSDRYPKLRRQYGI